MENLRIETQVIEAAHAASDVCYFWEQLYYPIREATHSRGVTANGRLEPTNAWYAIAKIAGIKLCEALWLQHGFDAISLMPTNLYGPGTITTPAEATFCLL